MIYQLVFQQEAYLDIKENPFLFQANEDKIRKAFLSRFPYQIYYFIKGNDIAVLGVLHTSRNHPKILRKRK